MKTFDWDFAEKTRNPKVVEWLKENHAEFVPEQRFVNELALIYRTSRKEGKYKHLNHEKWGKKVKPSVLRQQYGYLREKFGFFPFVV